MSPKLLILPSILLAASYAIQAEDARPHCDSQHVGEFWPQPEKGERSSIQELAQAGELQVCSRTSTWRYKWEQLTVTLDQLKKKRKSSSERTDRSGI